MTNRQAVLGAGCNDGISALIGACLGVALSIALSPLAPFGLARKAEPEPGIRLDGTVALIGLAATVVVVVGIGSLCTFVLLRRNGMRSDAGAEASGRSRVGSMLTEPVATGWRMAFSSGRAIAVSLIPPVLTVIALVVVATSVHNVVALPHHTELSGGSWDAFINREDYEDPSQAAVTEHLLATTPEVSAWARGGWIDVVIGATDVFTQVLEPGRGVEPSITRGRAPVGTNEIALGRKVLDQLGKDVGDTVTLDLSDRGGGQQSFDVVGEVIVASPLFQTLLPDAGALVSDRAYDKWLYEQPLAYLVAFRDGVTPTQGLDAVYAGYPDLGPFAFTRTARGDVVALDSMVALPWVLVVFLGLLTLASLVQWSVITSRRERHRAAVLRALGLTGAQVTAAFVIAALLVAGVAAVLGTVLGIAAAGAVWDVVAGWLIVVPRATVPWSVSVVALATMMLSALALAAIAGRRHAGSPAPQLRVE
jgi:hypothetical protein